MAKIRVFGYIEKIKDKILVLKLKYTPIPSITRPSNLQEYEVQIPLSGAAYNELKTLIAKSPREGLKIEGDLEISLSPIVPLIIQSAQSSPLCKTQPEGLPKKPATIIGLVDPQDLDEEY